MIPKRFKAWYKVFKLFICRGSKGLMGPGIYTILWTDNGWLKTHRTSCEEIENLLSILEEDYQVCIRMLGRDSILQTDRLKRGRKGK